MIPVSTPVAVPAPEQSLWPAPALPASDAVPAHAELVMGQRFSFRFDPELHVLLVSESEESYHEKLPSDSDDSEFDHGTCICELRTGRAR